MVVTAATGSTSNRETYCTKTGGVFVCVFCRWITIFWMIHLTDRRRKWFITGYLDIFRARTTTKRLDKWLSPQGLKNPCHTNKWIHVANGKISDQKPQHMHDFTSNSFSLRVFSGWRLDRVGKVVGLWDRVHTLAQPGVPSSPAQKRRKTLQRQHDGEQKLHRGALRAQ